MITYIDITSFNLSSTQLDQDPSQQKFFWNVSSESSLCNLTFTLRIFDSENSPEINQNPLIIREMVESGATVGLSSGDYYFEVISTALSGRVKVTSLTHNFSGKLEY